MVNAQAEIRVSGVEGLARLVVLVFAPVVAASAPHVLVWLRHRRRRTVALRPRLPEITSHDLSQGVS